MEAKVAVLVDANLVGEVFDREGPDGDPGSLVEHLLESFLERTKYDDSLWRWEWIRARDERDADDFEEKYGSGHKGYQWGPVLLRNGSRIRMSYQGVDHEAWVRHERIEYEGESYSPSQLASRIAGVTARNAWRDLLIQAPGEATFTRADELRRKSIHRAATMKKRPGALE